MGRDRSQPGAAPPPADERDGHTPRLSFDLQRFFTGASLVVFALIFLALSASAASLVHATLVNIAKDQADSVVEDIVVLCRVHGFSPTDWKGPMPPVLRTEILAEMDNFGFTELALHAPDGRELHRLSLEEGLPPFSWSEGLLEATDGEIALRITESTPWPLAMFGLGSLGEADLAVPIREEGRVAGVAMIHRASAPVLGLAHRVIPWLILLAGLASLGAFGALWLLVRRAANTIGAQADAIDRAQAELEQRNAQLVALHRQKDEFLAVCSHDLRSPILSVHAGCKLLLRDTPEAASSAREILSENVRSTERVIRLVDNLLDLARIEAGIESPQLEAIDVPELARESVRAAKNLADARGVRLVFIPREGAPPPPLHADRMMLLRVLSNLLSNAIKHSPPGEAVAMSVGWQAEEGPGIVIAVSDHGPGISPEKLPLLFQPFSVLSRHSRTREDGTGLGLSIAHRLVALHGGTIRVDSTPGEGARFEVVLPVYR